MIKSWSRQTEETKKSFEQPSSELLPQKQSYLQSRTATVVCVCVCAHRAPATRRGLEGERERERERARECARPTFGTGARARMCFHTPFSLSPSLFLPLRFTSLYSGVASGLFAISVCSIIFFHPLYLLTGKKVSIITTYFLFSWYRYHALAKVHCPRAAAARAGMCIRSLSRSLSHIYTRGVYIYTHRHTSVERHVGRENSKIARVFQSTKRLHASVRQLSHRGWW